MGEREGGKQRRRYSEVDLHEEQKHEMRPQRRYTAGNGCQLPQQRNSSLVSIHVPSHHDTDRRVNDSVVPERSRIVTRMFVKTSKILRT